MADEITKGQDFSGGSSLASEILDTFKHFSTCRGDLEVKWESNLAAFKRENSGVKWKLEEGEDWRSKTFLGVTRQKVLAAYALVVDGLVSSGKFPFDLVPGYDAETTSDDEPAVTALKNRINQQLYDSKSVEALKSMALSCAIYGECWGRRVLVPSVVRRYRKVAVPDQEAEIEYQQAEAAALAAGSEPPPAPEPKIEWAYDVESKTVPGWRYVSTWDVFRDLEEPDVQKGKAVIQVAMMSPAELRAMSGAGVIKDQIEAIGDSSAESPSSANDSSAPPDRRKTKWRYKSVKTLWYWGRVSKQAVEGFEAEHNLNPVVVGMRGDRNADTSGDLHDEVEVFAVVANDKVVRFCRVEPGERPWDWTTWEGQVDENAIGMGVADAAGEMQRVINGAVRAFEDNKKLSSNVLLAVREDYLAPGALDKWVPGKRIAISESCRSVSDAIQGINIPDIGDSVLSMLTYAERWLDEETLIPKISSGLTVNGESGKVTAYEMSTRIDRSGKYIGTVFKNFDHSIQSFIQWVFDVNMAGGDLDEACKGDYRVQAKGFDAFNDRASRITGITQFLGAVAGNEQMASRVNYEEPMRELCRLHNLNEEAFIKSNEQMQREAEARQNDPEYQLQLKERQLVLAEREATIMAKRAEAVEREARARALIAGIDQGAEKVRLEKADLVHSMETSARKVVTASTPGKPAHEDMPPAPGPARMPERGMTANNADGGAAGMMQGMPDRLTPAAHPRRRRSRD